MTEQAQNGSTGHDLPREGRPASSTGMHRDTTGRIERNALEVLGPLADALERETVTDVVINQDGLAWVKERGVWEKGGQFSPVQIASFLEDVAYLNGESISAKNPLLQARLPSGARVEAQFPPVVEAPTVAIRRHSDAVFPLEDYCREDPAAVDDLVALFDRMIDSRESIIFCGSVGSGKSSALSCFFRHLAAERPQDRLVTIEEVAELAITNPNCLRLEVRRTIGTMQELLEATLRSAPTWIVVGEVRTPEQALCYLQATNLGHPTASTIHVETAEKALSRLVDLTAEMHSVQQQSEWVGRVVRWIVRLAERTLPDGTGTYRAIMEVIEAEGYDRREGTFQTRSHYTLKEPPRLEGRG